MSYTPILAQVVTGNKAQLGASGLNPLFGSCTELEYNSLPIDLLRFGGG